MLLKRSTPQLTFERGNLEPKWNIGTKMEHFEWQNPAPHDTAEKKQKRRKPLKTLDFRHSHSMSVRGFEPRTT